MIDLRSDTLTLPDREMLESILSAKLGDDGREDSYGRGEDLSVNELEDLGASLTGKESALLFPSGTLANTSAILTFCKPGDNVIVDEMQHIYISEKIVFSDKAGQLNPVKYKLDKNSQPDADKIRDLLKSKKISLICLENTHNFSGGTCIVPEKLKEIKKIADSFNVPVHMDGARIFNAAAALGVSAGKICSHTDTVMFCISKGLGAPVGSLLCGSNAFIRKARATRKLFGGNMRQSGIIAAPGIYALKNNIDRLKEDNENAKYTAENLKKLKKIKVQENVQTNIVMLDTGEAGITPDEFCEKVKKLGLLIRPVIGNNVRMVFYKGITRKDAEKVVKIIRKIDTSL